MKFDICLMNPPYADNSTGGNYLDMMFVEKVNKIAKTQIVIHPAQRWVSNTKIGKSNSESSHLKSIEIINANEAFGISTVWKYAGIYYYDNTNNYDDTTAIFNGKIESIKCDDLKLRNEYYKTLEYSPELKNIINKKKKLYQELLEKYKTMVNDGHGFIYEERDLKRGAKYNIIKHDGIPLKDYKKRFEYFKQMLKDGKYKYCLYKGSFNNEYDKVQEWKGEDVDELFRGQICWLTNKVNVKNNIKYWLESPLCDLWRRYKFNLRARYRVAAGCAYGEIPALDFEMNEDEFKEYVDSLNDFTKEEIQILKDNNIHNADKL